jgi:hypothetical protein
MPQVQPSKLTENELQLSPADSGYTVKVVEGTVSPVLNGKIVTIAPEHELKISVTPILGSNSNDYGNSNAYGKLNAQGGKRNRKGANKTRKNKQEGGKRKLSGYMKFANKVRPDIMKENPGMPIPKLGSAIGAKWRALSDAEKKSYA